MTNSITIIQLIISSMFSLVVGYVLWKQKSTYDTEKELRGKESNQITESLSRLTIKMDDVWQNISTIKTELVEQIGANKLDNAHLQREIDLINQRVNNIEKIIDRRKLDE